ncbi:hypothetical protein [Actinomycetospora chiangmaiensis]|uniref:hypothetical protein n=1 Tax=Actinomycetospora chiangmaiensis TaxID=402650 RepID=UPI0012FB9F6D|nr:hypothetical protein [Actinomycetospora chiangmaiensis]
MTDEAYFAACAQLPKSAALVLRVGCDTSRAIKELNDCRTQLAQQNNVSLPANSLNARRFSALYYDLVDLTDPHDASAAHNFTYYFIGPVTQSQIDSLDVGATQCDASYRVSAENNSVPFHAIGGEAQQLCVGEFVSLPTDSAQLAAACENKHFDSSLQIRLPNLPPLTGDAAFAFANSIATEDDQFALNANPDSDIKSPLVEWMILHCDYVGCSMQLEAS